MTSLFSMKPERKRRLIIVLTIVSGVAIALSLLLYAMRQNINYFFTPTEILEGKAPRNHLVNTGGLVVKGSVVRDPASLKMQFKITDTEHEVVVHYEGILPDLFREGQGIISEGKIADDGTVYATQVLAKHDETYMSPEVADAIKKAEARAKARMNSAGSP